MGHSLISITNVAGHLSQVMALELLLSQVSKEYGQKIEVSYDLISYDFDFSSHD